MSEFSFSPLKKKVDLLPGTPGYIAEKVKFISLPKGKINEWRERYEIAARYLSRHQPPERFGPPEELAVYMAVLEEHQALKRYLYRSGHKQTVMQIDEELAQEQRNTFRLQWGRDDL